MRVAVPVEEPSLDSRICEHFGRAPFIAIVDVKDGQLKLIELLQNPAERHTPGMLPRLLLERGVEVVICGRIGPRARALLTQAGVRVIDGVVGTAKDAIRRVLKV